MRKPWATYMGRLPGLARGRGPASGGMPTSWRTFPTGWPILCTIGDGGFSMTLTELETCVRERLPFVTVVYNDSALSLIDVAQQNRGYPVYGVKYGPIDFAAVAA